MIFEALVWEIYGFASFQDEKPDVGYKFTQRFAFITQLVTSHGKQRLGGYKSTCTKWNGWDFRKRNLVQRTCSLLWNQAEVKLFVIISCTKILWNESYGTFGQVSWCEQEQSQGGCKL